VVVLVRVAGQDAVDPGADNLQEGVRGEARVAGVVEGVGEVPGEPDVFVKLPDGKEPGAAGESARRRLQGERAAEGVEDLRPGGWSTPH
jgi:hypothetical protein